MYGYIHTTARRVIKRYNEEERREIDAKGLDGASQNKKEQAQATRAMCTTMVSQGQSQWYSTNMQRSNPHIKKNGSNMGGVLRWEGGRGRRKVATLVHIRAFERPKLN